MCNDLNIGDRVYYTENGPEDKGTVDHIDMGLNRKYAVCWDDGSDGDVFIRSQLTKI